MRPQAEIRLRREACGTVRVSPSLTIFILILNCFKISTAILNFDHTHKADKSMPIIIYGFNNYGTKFKEFGTTPCYSDSGITIRLEFYRYIFYQTVQISRYIIYCFYLLAIARGQLLLVIKIWMVC